MAVNLRATATLNTKPFMASIRTIKAATESLNNSAIKGSSAVTSGALAEKAAREAASKAELSGSKSLTATTGKNVQANRHLTASQAEVNRELVRTSAAQGIAIDSMSKMTAAQQRQLTSARKYSQELRRHSELVAGGLEGPAAVSSIQRVERAADAVANANRAVAAAEVAHQSRIGQALDANMQKSANDFRKREALSARTAAAEVSHQAKIGHALDANMQKAANDFRKREAAAAAAATSQAATTKGIADAKAYTQSLSGLSQEQLKLQAASERVGAAQGRLASAIAKSNGVVTPAVASARAGVMSATSAYNALSEAQRNVGKTAMSAATGLNSQRYLYHDMSRQAMAAAGALAIIPIASIAAATAWQTSFANVVRTADPIFSRSTASVEMLRLSLVDMVQTMPASWGDVTEIATLANQMGIAAHETAAFTKSVAMFSATSGVSVDVTATAFGRLNSIVKLSEGGFQGLADSILKVGVNSVATEDEIINIVTQISSIAGAAGLTDKEMIGLAGSMASVRIPPELSRGVITRVFGQISRATTTGGIALEGFSRIAGMTSKDFKDSWGQEGVAGEAFVSFMDGLRNLGPQAEAALRSLGITSVRDVPVLLRMANAKDSEGNVGGLIRQTFDDANKAAGETQRQYAIMADTIGAKLKVVGNNLMAFFAGIGASGLGPAGDVLDTITEALRNMTNSLDENFKLFGKIELPITTAEVLGWAGAIATAAAGLLVLGSMATKLAAGVVTMKSFAAIVSGGAFVGVGGSIASQWRAVPSVMGKATTAVAGFAAKYATLAGMGTAMKLTGINAPGAAMISAEAAAKKATAAVTTGYARMGAAAVVAGGIMGRAASLAFGPWGLLIAGAIYGINALVESTRAASTDAGELAQQLAKTNGMVKAMEGITLGGLFGREAKPFEGGIRNLQDYTDKLNNLRKKELASGGGGFSIASIGSGGDKKGLGDLKNAEKAAKEWAAAVKSYDESFQEMANAGNGAKAATDLQKFMGTNKNLMELLDSPSAKNVRRYFDAAFATERLEVTEDNLNRLAAGALPGVRGALLGMGIAAGEVNALMEDFDGGAEAWAAVAERADSAAKSMISFSDITAAATDEFNNFSMDKFIAELDKSIAAQDNWSANMAIAGRVGGTDFVNALLEIGPEAAAAPLQAIIDDMNANGGQLTEVGRGWMEKIIRGTQSGSAVASAEFGLMRDSLVATLGDVDIANALGSKLTADQYTTFTSAMKSMGKEGALELANGIISEGIGINEALATAILADGQVKLGLDFDLTPAQLSLNTIEALANNTISYLQLDALPELAEGHIWEVITMANGQTGFVKVDAKTGEAVTKVAHVVDAAGKAVGDVTLTANDIEAINKIRNTEVEAEKARPTVTVSAYDNASKTIDWIARNRTATITVQQIEASNAKWGRPAVSGGMADGGVVSYYANGGVRESHIAQIAPAGAMRVWAEPETGGEAYIPLAQSKRLRSEAILSDVADRFGYSLTPINNVSQYANGGTYELQSRSRYGRMRNDIQGSDGYGKRELNVHIHNPVEKNWANDAWEKIQELGGALDI